MTETTIDRRTLLTRLLALILVGTLPAETVAAALDEPSPYGIEPYDRDEPIGWESHYPPILWEATVYMLGHSRQLDGEMNREAFITAYADGSGRISISRVHGGSAGPTGDLFGDELPFVAARIDPDTFRAFWLGLGALAPDQPMTAETVAANRVENIERRRVERADYEARRQRRALQTPA